MNGDCWIQTFTGRRFVLNNPDPATVEIEDIAHALANLCRFTGHTRSFYSVAQHSVLVSLNCGEENALWGLLHDASEAYLGDVTRPLKKGMRTNGNSRYDDFENVVTLAIARQFGLSVPMPKCVKAADNLLLVTESRDLMAPVPPDWHYQIANGYRALHRSIEPVGPEAAKAMFLERFEHLTGKRAAPSFDPIYAGA